MALSARNRGVEPVIRKALEPFLHAANYERQLLGARCDFHKVVIEFLQLATLYSKPLAYFLIEE